MKKEEDMSAGEIISYLYLVCFMMFWLLFGITRGVVYLLQEMGMYPALSMVSVLVAIVCHLAVTEGETK